MKPHQHEYWEREALLARRTPDHAVVRAYTARKMEIIQERIPISSSTTILDVGCGNGFYTQPFGTIGRAVGVDYSLRMLLMNPHRPVARMDVSFLAFKDNVFDIVFCNSLLHHVADIDLVLSEMKRVSRKHVVLIEPNRNNPLMALFCLLVKEERAGLRFSLRCLAEGVRSQGLRIVDAFSFGMIVPNKAPAALLPFLKPMERRFALGIENVLIAEK